MKLVVKFASTVVSRREVGLWVAAVRAQLKRDFQPYWHIDTSLRLLKVGEGAAADEWLIIINDESTAEGCLGYHDLDSAGKPVAFVSVQTVLADGGVPSAVFSHECLEMAADPKLYSAVVLGRRGMEAVSIEVCDPVQEDMYAINGVSVSNFVFPAYFEVEGKGPFDFLNRLRGPFTVSKGGYLIVYTHEKNWHTIEHPLAPAKTKNNPRGRSARIKASVKR